MVSSFALWAQGETFHLYFGADAGTTGVGGELIAAIGSHFAVRAGVTVTPRLYTDHELDVQLNGQPVEATYDASGNRNDHMGRVMEFMQSFTGLTVKEHVNAHSTPSMLNGRVIADWYPLCQRSWHVSAGCFFGPAVVARFSNVNADMDALTAIGIYNGIYDRAIAGEPVISFGSTTISFPSEYTNHLANYGQLTIASGTMKDGSYLDFGPGPDGMVRAQVRVNTIRPYLGCGYEHGFGQQKRTTLSLDLGCLFWGGKPRIMTGNGVDLARDVESLTGDLKDWVDTYKSLSVYPVLEIRITRRLF